MKKISQGTFIILELYISVICIVYFAIVYSALLKARVESKSSIPSLSVSGIQKADKMFSDFGKEWVGYPSNPDLSKYSFGKDEPFR